MKKILLIIVSLIAITLSAQDNDSFTIKEMRLPDKYNIIIDRIVSPYIKDNEVKMTDEVVVLRMLNNQTKDIEVALEVLSACHFNSMLYYQYFDSILVVTPSEDFGKYVVPEQSKKFKKVKSSLVLDGIKICSLKELDNGWAVLWNEFDETFR